VHDIIFENGEGEMSVYENSRPHVNVAQVITLLVVKDHLI